MLRDSANLIAKPLTAIINFSLKNGYVPSEWKSARVIPLLKKGKAENLDNYRPASILPAASKILERAVHTQLYNFLTREQLLNPYQCSFRKGHSTELAVLSFTDSIHHNMDQGLLTGVVFVDLSKAFDTIDHELLLQKLSLLYEIEGIELAWFRDYLSERSQVVAFHSTLSEAAVLLSGVLQGSILGPLLFILFINDLPSTINKCNILLYADGAVIFVAHKDIKEIEETLNDELNEVNTWTLHNFLFINKSKTEFVLFGTAARLSKVSEVNLFIDTFKLNRVYEFKYLGVVLDDSLTWKEHVKYVTAKGAQRIGMLGEKESHSLCR